MLSTLKVADYMSGNVITFPKDMDVFTGIKKLLDHKITSAPVVDENGQMIGMFSEKSGLKVFLESIYDQGVSGKVGEYLLTGIETIDEYTSIVDVAEKFETSPFRSFPVLRDGKLIGIISRVDVLKALISA